MENEGEGWIIEERCGELRRGVENGETETD